MIKKLSILEKIEEDKLVEPNLRLKIDINLDKMTLILEKKLKSLEVIEEYSKTYTIDEESELDDILDEYYKEYLKLKSIENYWSDALKDTEVIEFNLMEEKKEED
jgi:hypothetical protein